MPKLVTERSGTSSKIMFFRIVKSLKLIVETSAFDGLEGCARERYRYQKSIKNETQIHAKIYENQYKNHARIRGSQKDEKSSKIDRKLEPKSITNLEKQSLETDAKKEAHACICPAGRRVGRPPLLRLNHIFSVCSRLRLVILLASPPVRLVIFVSRL